MSQLYVVQWADGNRLSLKPQLQAYNAVELARLFLVKENPEYAQHLGEVVAEWAIGMNSAELWWLPYDHGPTKDTGLRVVLADV